MNDSKIMGFVATKNHSAAKMFYEKALGLEFIRDEPYALVFDANGTILRVQKVEKLSPAEHTILGWVVGDIRTEVRELSKRGVHFEHFDSLPQDKDGVWTTPDGARVAWFKDPDGNILSLTQFR